MNMVRTYHERLIEVIQLNAHDINIGIERMSNEIAKVSEQGNTVWVIGNGGSASNAEHFETDLAYLRQNNLTSYPVVSALTANSALISATSNDISYEELFGVMLKRKGKANDYLIAISASGNSKNILNAIVQAKSQGIRTFSLLGFNGGKAKIISDDSLVVLTNIGEYGIVEDVHLSILHAVSLEILRKISN